MLTSASGGIALSYDPAMRLYQTSGGSADTARFAYDGAALIAEYNRSNAMLRRYVHGPGSDEPLVWYEGSATSDRRFLHSDERGSVAAVTNSSGTPPPQATPIQLKPSTKKYLCQKLASHGFDIPAAYSDIFAFRNKSRENMQVAEAREAENWIYATGNWRRIPTDGTSRFWVRTYQKYLKPFFSNATPYSEDALNAGLNGADHRGMTQAQLSRELKDYCHG